MEARQQASQASQTINSNQIFNLICELIWFCFALAAAAGLAALILFHQISFQSI